MRQLLKFLLLLLPLVVCQDDTLPLGPCDLVTSEECLEVIENTACYNGAVQRGNTTALMSCYSGGEQQVRTNWAVA